MTNPFGESGASSAKEHDLTRQRAIVLACLSIGCLLAATASAQPTSRLTLRSSSPLLEESFAWAKDQTLGCVRTGQRPGYVACYFAAMSDTEFCVRDVAHMMEGAHLLGLDRENWSMMSMFAWGANRRVKQDAKKVDVSVAGVKHLKLVVTDAGDGINSDHADWAGARLVP